MNISKLELQTSNLLKCKDFYTKVLDLVLLSESDTSFSVKAGATELVFHQTEDPSSKPFYHFAFNIPQNMFQEAKAWLQARVELSKDDGKEEVHSTNWNSHAVYFDDAVGNILEFIARHQLNNDANGPFSSEHILNVSEIGLPSEDVLKTVAELTRQLNLSTFREPSTTFAPVGDEDGLFIVSKFGRVWFMSDKPAHYHPVRVTFTGTQPKTLTLSRYDFTVV